jgi:tetraacyldisaccharide 4'-kinase
VISVGNITVGGTGKTPLVEYIVRHCLARGRRVAVVSRGFRRASRGLVIVSDGHSVLADASTGGDEPVQIARKFPQAVVVVGERRREAALVAVERLGAEVVVLDDGFQHRYLARDLDIVVVDSGRDSPTGMLLPAGPLREPWDGMRRADVVVMSKIVSVRDGAFWKERLGRWYSGPVILSGYRTECVLRLPGNVRLQFEELRKHDIVAFSGIGDHDEFVRGLRRQGLAIRSDIRFPDHHWYRKSDIRRLGDFRSDSAGVAYVTTEKDGVRLMADPFIVDNFLRVCPVYCVRIQVDILSGREEFLSLLDNCLEPKPV